MIHAADIYKKHGMKFLYVNAWQYTLKYKYLYTLPIKTSCPKCMNEQLRFILVAFNI